MSSCNPLSDRVLVVDDVIPQKIQDRLETLCLSNEHFRYAYTPSGNYGLPGVRKTKQTFSDFHRGVMSLPNVVDSPRMMHLLYLNDKVHSNFYKEFVPILEALPFPVDEIVKMKAQISMPLFQTSEEAHGVPHVDVEYGADIITGIYYINNSSGDTYIFNEYFENKVFKSLTVKERVAPKKGRMVLFDGRHLHAGNTPREDVARAVLNLNIISKEKNEDNHFLRKNIRHWLFGS